MEDIIKSDNLKLANDTFVKSILSPDGKFY